MVFNKTDILIIIVFLNLSLISASGQLVSVDYSSFNNTLYETDLSFNSVLLKINTESNFVCRYSLSNVSYENMEENFDPSLGRVHEKTFTNLEDKGIYEYYIKCVNPDNYTEPPLLKIIFKINSFVNADIFLDKDSPLKDGRVEVKLVVSKPVFQKPALSYSFDGIVYNKIFLTSSGDVWKGYILIPKSLDESILSFKFSGVDLEGKVGEIINTGESFLIDTTEPGIIIDLSAVGYEGEIKLNWYLNEETKEFKIYRSESPNLDYTDFYTMTDENPFYDHSVEKGKTYYYKVAAIDDAGNEAKLSREVYATALLDNKTISSGLAVQLRGFVDNFLSEVDSVLSEAEVIKNSISGEKNNFFLDLGLNKEVDNKKQELEILKTDAEKFKLQDLTKEELDKKLDSLRLKLSIIRKQIPEDIVILEENSEDSKITEVKIEKSILELEPEISEKEKENSMKETLKIIKDSNLVVNSYYYSVEIIYLDGSKEAVSFVKRNINAELEKGKGFFVEIIPKTVAESSSELNVKNSVYKVVKEDPVLSFGSDTKQIIYSFEKKLEINDLKSIEFSFAQILKDENKTQDSGITGYFFLDLNQGGYFGIVLGLLIIGGLFIYFIYLRNSGSEFSLEILDKVERALEFLDKNNSKKTCEIYDSIAESYKSLDNKDKKAVYKKVEFLHNSILVFDFENKLETLKISKDKELLDKLEKIYKSLSDDFKKKIYSSFEKVKEDIKNGI